MISSITDDTIFTYIDTAKKINAKFVFLVSDRMFDIDETEDLFVDKLTRIVSIFNKNGIRTGCWMTTLGYGNPLDEKAKKKTEGFLKISDVDGSGNPNADCFCPLDKRFVDFTDKKIKAIIKSGIRTILLDDELCLSVRPGVGCGCEKHMNLFNERVGEKVDRQRLLNHIISGKPNKYRTAWVDLMGETLKDFCIEIRKFVDTIDSDVKIGLCTGFTSWDVEGVNPCELAKILAGKNRPLLRLSGATYWHIFRDNVSRSLERTIEFVRQQEYWCKGYDIELLDENDTYPRPRYVVPAAYVEIYDLALRFTTNINSLKYVFDYFAKPDYEAGYVKAHIENEKVRAWIDKNKTEKTIGLHIVDEREKIKDITIAEHNYYANARRSEWQIKRHNYLNQVFDNGAEFLIANSVPTNYEESDNVSIAFGQNVNFLSDNDFDRGLIIDIPAAIILQERGIDVGLRDYRLASVSREYFGDNFDNVIDYTYLCDGRYYKLKIDSDAEISSVFIDNGKSYPFCYYYENAENKKFLVYAFDGYSLNQKGSVFRSYYRQRQLYNYIRKMGGKTVIQSVGNPRIYIQCGQAGNDYCIFIANVFEDKLIRPSFVLDGEYKIIDIVNGSARIEKDNLIFNSNIEAYSCVCIRIGKK